jgi:hypothetical protein
MVYDDCRQKVYSNLLRSHQNSFFFIQLEGFGWSSLVGIDVNNENFCGAGIIHTASQQIGCLYRLEPNKQAKVNSFFLLSMKYFLH